MLKLDKYYQPVPFEEYKNIEAKRKDCEERYAVIKKNYGDFKDKTLIDLCCANGYFLFRFMQDGGRLARGIEIDKNNTLFINTIAFEKQMDILCDIHLNGFRSRQFDIGIYLDTHYHLGTMDYPAFLAMNTKVCFTSCARSDDADWKDANERYEKLLKTLFKEVVPIYTGFAGRIIYRCE